MSETDQIMRRVGLAIMLAPLLIGLPVALFAGSIDVSAFLAVAALWLVIALILIAGPSRVLEVSFGSASIKLDALATKEARIEVEAIRDQLRTIARAVVEDAYILSSTSDELRCNPLSLPSMRLSENMNKLWQFVESDPQAAHYARQEVRGLFGHPPDPYLPSK